MLEANIDLLGFDVSNLIDHTLVEFLEVSVFKY